MKRVTSYKDSQGGLHQNLEDCLKKDIFNAMNAVLNYNQSVSNSISNKHRDIFNALKSIYDEYDDLLNEEISCDD